MFALLLAYWLSSASGAQDFQPLLYSPYGEELTVSFDGIYLTNFKSIEEMNLALPSDRSNYVAYSIEPALKYLFGPLTHRGWAGIKKTLSLEPHWDAARMTERGVELPYSYRGLWLIDVRFLDQRRTPIPLPYNTSILLSPRWQDCTDQEHNTQSFYWYYWDPSRYGCDHKVGQHYQNITPSLSLATQETQQTFPEYQRMKREREGRRVMPMTFAFGYYKEPENPNPDKDLDVGAREYQVFLRELKKILPANHKESKIMKSTYPNSWGRDWLVGHRYTFTQNDVEFDIKVVMNAGVDQMLLFARSYAEENDGYFGWMGHSRVGSGFDAHRFEMMVRENPERYSISKDYQLIYWGGCNSYSYYTEPFFAMKALVNPDDPQGSKALDIIANGLPSFFSLNSDNAIIHLKALLGWANPRSYQSLLQEMENQARQQGTRVLAVVLGDEDNP